MTKNSLFRRLKRTLQAVAVTAMGVLAFGSPRSVAQEAVSSWTSSDGKVVEAEFVRLEDREVVLRLKSSGQEVKVPLSRLDINSHYNALRLADPEAFNKPLVKAPDPTEPLEVQSTFAASDILESPFAANLTIDQFMGIVKEEMDRGNQFVIWHALPNKMQVDMETLANKGIEKIGPETIDRIGKTRTRIGPFMTISICATIRPVCMTSFGIMSMATGPGWW